MLVWDFDQHKDLLTFPSNAFHLHSCSSVLGCKCSAVWQIHLHLWMAPCANILTWKTLNSVQVRFKELEDKEIYVIMCLYQAQIIRRGIRFLIFDCI